MTNNNNKNNHNTINQNNDNIIYPQWHNWVGGASAGAGARVFTTPLDIIRIRRQLASHGVQASNENLFVSMYKLFEGGGIPALFRGNVAAMNLWVGYTAVQFALYNDCKQYLESSPKTLDFLSSLPYSCGVANEVTIAFVSGAMAGTAATLSTYPFDICRTAFAARCVHDTTTSSTSRPPKTMQEFTIQLYQQKGLGAFFAGAGPAVLQIIPYMGLNFCIYDYLTKDDDNQVVNSGLAGSISGAISKMAVYPMDTVKKRLQAQAFLGPIMPPNSNFATPYNYKGVIDCFVKIMEIEGIQAFYRGLVPSVLKTTLSSGLSFSIYRFTKNVLECLHDGYSFDSEQFTPLRRTTTKSPTATLSTRSSLSSTSTSSSSSSSPPPSPRPLQRTVSATSTNE